MTENNTPDADESNEANNAADAFFAADSSTQTSTPITSRSKWLMPGAAVAGAALLAGLIGFTVGNQSGPDFRPAAVAGQMIPGQDGPGQAGNGTDGDHDGGRNGNYQDNDGHGKQGRHGQKGQTGQQGMMPGSPQMGTDLPPTTPHCHDATGADVEVGADGLCADGSQPGMRGKGGMSATPVPSASSSTSIQ